MTKFDVILADPPWPYRKKIAGGSAKSAAIQKYPTLSLGDIHLLPIADITNPIAYLFLWATVPNLPMAVDTLSAWGFTYKTMITWVKPSIGMGSWFRGQTEHVLVGVKGKWKAFWCQKSNIIRTTTKLAHSEKPEEMRKLIELAVPPGSLKAELFARKNTPGWHAWGRVVVDDFVMPGWRAKSEETRQEETEKEATSRSTGSASKKGPIRSYR